MTTKTRVAYLEDQKIVREGVSYLLAQYPAIEMISAPEAGGLEDFLHRNNTDVLILDLQLTMPNDKVKLNGFEVCEMVTKRFPTIKTIAHSMYDNIETVNKFFASGGMAFVSKKSGHAELVDAIEHVKAGKKFLCKEISTKVKNLQRFLRGDDPELKATNELFTKTEKNVLEKIAKGYSTKQVAQILDISEKTVETHRKHLFDKADVKNVAELIAFAYSRRLFID
jgi:DNA-binding NarL/FixJ family response regulator